MPEEVLTVAELERLLAAALAHPPPVPGWPHHELGRVCRHALALEAEVDRLRQQVEVHARACIAEQVEILRLRCQIEGHCERIFKQSELLSRRAEKPDRPRRVALCGSSRFKAEHIEAMRQETLAGRIVLPMGLYGHVEGLDMAGPVKEMLDRLHLAKIDAADEVLVINLGGYVGASTRREIEYALSLGKPVRYTCPPSATRFTTTMEKPNE
jgi:hypothetical protein